ncbi:FAD-dependent oxidoreductase [Sagittula salina]|uniref:FAD-dependent oxidoreductase n=1 Tax=Sagittula salina TaxID=2820268 RepID=A0A940MTF6_9RHOB|nr:FAD-dependent oxidoreductase [Sagittula salina]MBP0484732.1 FAD-dependent oxidoreductase [Sagittula salina]
MAGVRAGGSRVTPRIASVDMVVLGSGAAGLTAALTGSLDGLRVLVLEHEEQVGGTSARSSGSVWIPGNGFARAARPEDAAEAAVYLDALVGERAPHALRRAFLAAGPRMLEDLETRAGIAFRAMPASPDYRQDIPGAAPGWRPLDPVPFDGRSLGDWFARLAPPLPELTVLGGMMVTRPEAAALLRADRDAGAAAIRLGLRHARDRLRHARGTRLVLGNALVARLLHACLVHGVDIRTGVVASRIAPGVVHLPGESIRAKAIILAGGGFPASEAKRAEHLPDPTPRITPAAPGARGTTLDLGLAAGAQLGPSGLDNALWFPCSTMVRPDRSTAIWPHIVLDRAKPGSLCVGRDGRRFVNEAVSYHEFVRAMYRHRDTALPCWLIADRAFVRRYGLGLIRPRTPSLRRYIRAGYLTAARDLPTLARALGMPATALCHTIERFNGFCTPGIDEDFGRGETLYDRANGDPGHGPNPCLGRLGDGPYYAVRMEPAPLGTSRGLATDARARVLDAEGAPIDGLYACGNDMHSAFGGEYPGAGAQLGQAMTFGWLAARHAAGIEREDP